MSLRNLRVETIDVYYLHNPEHQLEVIDRDTFLTRLKAAFECLEQRVAEGKIRSYGTATWNGFRSHPTARASLSLEQLVELARRVGGAHHHFRVIQLPYNLAMPEAFAFRNQRLNGSTVTLLEAARSLGISVVISASLLQGQLARLPAQLTTHLPGPLTDAQRALQFVRSTPGVTTALIGMKQLTHLKDNLALAAHPLLDEEQIQHLFHRA
jgi:aryl-alcohol dehydrogenase-like predicted oxidoreductase